jgi:hypothetical protein
VEECGGGGLQAAQAIERFAEMFQLGGEEQGAGVVVRAVAMVEIGHIVHGVLEDARGVRHGLQVVETPGRQLQPLHRQGGGGPEDPDGALARFQQALEQRGIAFPHRRPHHVATRQPALLAQGVQPAGLIQQSVDRLGDRRPIAKGHQQAPTLRQQLLRVPIGGAHHRFARAVAVGQGAGGDLGGVEIGREIDISGTDVFD